MTIKMTLLLYSWFKVITTLGVIWPLASFLTEQIAGKYMQSNKRLPDLVQITTSGIRGIIKPFSRIKDIAAFSSSFYGAAVCTLYSSKLFDSFVNFMCGVVLIRCLFFMVTVLKP